VDITALKSTGSQSGKQRYITYIPSRDISFVINGGYNCAPIDRIAVREAEIHHLHNEER